MKKYLIGFLIIFALAALAFGLYFAWKNLRGIGPAIKSPVSVSDSGVAGAQTNPQTGAQTPSRTSGLPLKLPDDFSISIAAKNLKQPRVMAPDEQGNIWVSEMGAGAVTKLEIRKGRVVSQKRMIQNLRKPHGLAFDPDDPGILFIGEEHRISRVRITDAAPAPQKIADLPSGDGHFTRTLKFGPDGRLYVSIGSSCNACREKDARRAAIFSLKKDGGDFRPFAQGLRNTVFFVWDEVRNQWWGADMGRDYLGDDLPPDEINIIKEDRNYGWPLCYGKSIRDKTFDGGAAAGKFCQGSAPSHLDLPAHSAPLGLAFVPEKDWPAEYRGDLFIAFHGSWNRSQPTGYKIVRVDIDDDGRPLGMEDFISGWLVSGGALGRPVDLLMQPGGLMYVTDDKAGAVYQVAYQPQNL